MLCCVELFGRTRFVLVDCESSAGHTRSLVWALARVGGRMSSRGHFHEIRDLQKKVGAPPKGRNRASR